MYGLACGDSTNVHNKNGKWLALSGARLFRWTHKTSLKMTPACINAQVTNLFQRALQWTKDLWLLFYWWWTSGRTSLQDCLPLSSEQNDGMPLCGRKGNNNGMWLSYSLGYRGWIGEMDNHHAICCRRQSKATWAWLQSSVVALTFSWVSLYVGEETAERKERAINWDRFDAFAVAMDVASRRRTTGPLESVSY